MKDVTREDLDGKVIVAFMTGEDSFMYAERVVFGDKGLTAVAPVHQVYMEDSVITGQALLNGDCFLPWHNIRSISGLSLPEGI